MSQENEGSSTNSAQSNICADKLQEAFIAALQRRQDKLKEERQAKPTNQQQV